MSSDKKEHIINTAISLFSTKGFEGTSIRDLAAKAGVNLAMINYYFGSKEKLFEYLIEQRAAHMHNMLDEIVNNKSLTHIERIHAIINILVDKIFDNAEFQKVLLHEIMLNQRECLSDAIINIVSKNIRIIRNIIDNGIKNKEFNNVNPTLTVATLFGTINEILASQKLCALLTSSHSSVHNNHFYKDETLKTKVKEHLKQLLNAHLLPSHSYTSHSSKNKHSTTQYGKTNRTKIKRAATN
jgi:AcrR family transcriptional regulator